jgi:pimeloyl-ACP methyl ester carboxylesterase
MKKLFVLFIILALGALCLNVFAQHNPYPFEVKIKGQGKKALLFIPGLACSGDVWEETVQHYEQDYTCYIFTMAGFAGVPAQEAPSFQDWIRAIADYVKQQKIPKPVVVGHSIGGGMALALSAQYPSLFSKVVVVDAVPCLSALMNPSFTVKENPDCSGTVNQMMQMNETQFYQSQKMMIRRMLADTAQQEKVVQWGVRSDRRTIATLYCQFSNTDLRSSLSTIQCPALILLEAPFNGIKEAVDGQYKQLSTGQLQYAPKGLHFIMYDDKDWYLGQLDNFLKQ